MNPGITEFLEKWKSTIIYDETKSYSFKPHPLIPSEFAIQLSIYAVVKIENITKEIEVNKSVFTIAQSSFEWENLTENGDLINLKNIVEEIDNKFINEYELKVEEISQEIHPDGFFH